MLLKRLYLKNIRSYVEQQIEFPQGAILLSGDIGSGKSTILLAIEFALFGVKGKELPASALLRHGANEGVVELEFSLQEKHYTVGRFLKRTKTSIKQEPGFLIEDGVKSNLTPVELKNKVLDVLGYPSKIASKTKDLIYRYTIYTAQEQMKHILFDEQERLSTLRRVFQIDKYEIIKNNSQQFLRYIKSVEKADQIHIEDLEDKKAELKEIKQQIVTKKQDLAALIEQIESVAKSLSELREQKKVLDSKKREADNFSQELKQLLKQETESVEIINKNEEKKTVLSKELEKLKSDFESIVLEKPTEKSDEVLADEIDKLENWLKEISNKQTVLVEQKKNFAGQAEQLQKDLKQMQDNVSAEKEKKESKEKLEQELRGSETLAKDIEQVEKEIQNILKQINELEFSKKNSEDLKVKISELSSCPTCLQDVDEGHKEKILSRENSKIDETLKKHGVLEQKKNELQQKLKSLKEAEKKKQQDEQRIKVLESELKNIESNKKMFEEKKVALDEVKNKCEGVEKELADLKDTDVVVYEEKLKRLKEDRKQLNDYHRRIEKKKSIKERYKDKKEQLQDIDMQVKQDKEKLANLRERKKELEESLARYSDINKQVEENEGKLQDAINKEKEFYAKKTGIETEQNNLAKQQEKLKEDIEKKEKIKEHLIRVQDYQFWMQNGFTKLVENIEKHVMLRVYNEFNEQFVAWFLMLVEDDTISARLDEAFSPVIEQNGYETDIEYLSGGEKTSVALAYRLALNKVINDLISSIKTKDLLVLDEPTDGFSSEQLDRVRDVLDQLHLKQILLVSHEPKLETFVENIIRVKKNEHVSAVEQV